MSPERALYELGALELAAGFRDKRFTPLDALAAIHERIDDVNPRINAVIAEDRPAALEQARASGTRWAQGAPLSVLDGVPITIKDNIHVAGLPATWGSRLHDDGAPREDEPAIAKLRSAGLVFIGKTNVPEFTLQGYTDNALFGVTRNPLAPDRTPGGSTGGGAAAVAAGIGPVAIGTDGGGSIRRPAAHCGLWGLKPSIGQIARSGGFPQILADFEVIGPVTRNLPDLAAVYSLLTGFDRSDPRSLAAEIRFGDSSPLPRIGYFPSVGSAPVDRRISAAAAQFVRDLEQTGCAIETIEAPFVADEVNPAWGTVAQGGVAWHLASIPGASDRVGANARAMLEAGRQLSASDYVDALDRCHAIRRRASELFGSFDFLLCPTTAALAWPAHEPFPPRIENIEVGPRGHAVFTAWMNVAGLCAMSIPVAVTSDAGGIGVQLIAAPGRDRDLMTFLATNPVIAAQAPRGPVKDIL